MASQTAQQAEPKSTPKTSKYMDRALEVLERFGVATGKDVQNELIRLLEEVRHVDEARALAIANTVKHMSEFNQLVRENVENINVGNRYLEISQMFDSIREDSKRLIAQLDDGKIGLGEKMSNVWMNIRRGSPHARFEKIVDVYQDVCKETKNQLDREEVIMDGYIDFRFALKEAEIMARELLQEQLPHLEAAKKSLADAQQAVSDYSGDDESQQSRLELQRDEAHDKWKTEDRIYQLCKDIAENLAIGYDVGETLVTKLRQTHDVKEQVYRRAVTFFTTNEHVFTILGTVYTSQQGLHEATQSTEALKEGVNKSLEDVAELGQELERAALKAGYGSTISPDSLEKLVSAISDYQVESLKMVADLRKESEQNAREIRRVVEEGKARYQNTLAKFALGASEEDAQAAVR
ncbi:cell surface protein [Aeoliella sp. ICT_H6.2]|uniref:Cell surface protein n=1 Tax=Aeoliella straminimaris TaxID=2954799 RepID=A0A9X2JIV1_9BACT|nr:cell surface protein [Aeoliella straminimaris]MCO6047485.1 cell surface protein [Aeoliella straminimaris]